jgi:pimeloyl-ACP methyl ester carboxylesterase
VATGGSDPKGVGQISDRTTGLGRRVDANGLSFHVVERGQGEPVLLLHGFPDTSRLWRNQFAALESAGFRAVAPDLRGRGESEKPCAVGDYALPILVQDVLSILDAVGIERAHVVGHDWGAALAWALAIGHPERVNRLVVISVPHPAIGRSVKQLEKFWYIFFFQFAGIAEEALSRDGWRLFREWLRGQGDIESYVEDLSRPGALSAGLNWYRANATPAAMVSEPPPGPPVRVPTLGICGAHDIALLADRIAASGSHVGAPWRFVLFEDAGHWIPLECPDRLNRLLIDFLGESRR